MSLLAAKGSLAAVQAPAMADGDSDMEAIIETDRQRSDQQVSLCMCAYVCTSALAVLVLTWDQKLPIDTHEHTESE